MKQMQICILNLIFCISPFILHYSWGFLDLLVFFIQRYTYHTSCLICVQSVIECRQISYQIRLSIKGSVIIFSIRDYDFYPFFCFVVSFFAYIFDMWPYSDYFEMSPWNVLQQCIVTKFIYIFGMYIILGGLVDYPLFFC